MNKISVHFLFQRQAPGSRREHEPLVSISVNSRRTCGTKPIINKIKGLLNILVFDVHKNSLDFTPNEFNGFTVDEFGNHISMSKSNLRFWKSQCHIIQHFLKDYQDFISFYSTALTPSGELS